MHGIYLRFKQIYRARSKLKDVCGCALFFLFFLREIVRDVVMEEGILIVRQITMRLSYSCPAHTHTHTYRHTRGIIIVTEGERLIIGQRCL